jgi:YHS domain-containing protein
MKKFLTLGFIFIGATLVFAEPTPTASSAQQSAVQSVDAGNKFCPVSGRPIGAMGPGVPVQYNGKTYHLCCGGCIATFNSDPAKYAKIAHDKNKS